VEADAGTARTVGVRPLEYLTYRPIEITLQCDRTQLGDESDVQ
jgi:hypothetical protein